MIERKESEGAGASGRKLDPRLDDPPKPVVYAGEGSPLTAKIAKLTERLAVTSPVAPAPAPPALLMSGSLNEARAYLEHIQPVAGEEPITLEMRRVRIADEVNSATWVTERVDRSLSLSPGAPALEVTQAPASAGRAVDVVGEVLSVEEGSQPRRSSRARALGIVGLSCALVAGMVVLAAGGKRSLAGETLAQPALVPFGLVELTASLSGEVDSLNEGTAQALAPVPAAQDKAQLESPSAPALSPAATTKLTGSHGVAGPARWTPQRGGLKQTRKVPLGTPGPNEKPELVTNDPTY